MKINHAVKLTLTTMLMLGTFITSSSVVSADDTGVNLPDYKSVNSVYGQDPNNPAATGESQAGVKFANGDLVIGNALKSMYFGKQMQFSSTEWNFQPINTTDDEHNNTNRDIMDNSIIVSDYRGQAGADGWRLSVSLTPFYRVLDNDQIDTNDIQGIKDLVFKKAKVYAVRNFSTTTPTVVPGFTAVDSNSSVAPPNMLTGDVNNYVSVSPSTADTPGGIQSSVVWTAPKNSDRGRGDWALEFQKAALVTGPNMEQKVGNYRSTITWNLSSDATSSVV